MLTMNAAYKALRTGAAWIDLSGRGTIRVTGEDRARLLHALSTQDIQTMQPGEGSYTFFLNAQGRILADANVFCFEDHFLLDTEPETARSLYEHIDRYIIADDVTIADDTARTATIAVEGPETERALRDLGARLPENDHATTVGSDGAWGDVIVARVSTTGAGGYLIFVPVTAKEAFVAKLAGLPEADREDARIVRIEHGLPRYGEEITDRYLIQETGQLRAVNFNKGCYLGQEIVERVRSRGQVHRVLRKLELERSEVLAPGTKIVSAGADAAEIASCALSPASGQAVALAYVRAPFAEAGTVIDSGVFTARVA